VKVRAPGLQFYVDKLNAGEQFCFARYGNGEWDLVLGRGTHTGSRSQTFTSELHEAMRGTLTDARAGMHYAIQTGYLTTLRMMPSIEKWLAAHALSLAWHEGDVFHHASGRGQLAPLVNALRQRSVVIVGPPWLERLPFADAMVELRPQNCWQDADVIAAQVRMYRDCVVSFSAGPAAKVLIHRLYPEMSEHSWLIDFGSLWDVYCGKRSRRYHRQMTKKTIEKNIGSTNDSYLYSNSRGL